MTPEAICGSVSRVSVRSKNSHFLRFSLLFIS